MKHFRHAILQFIVICCAVWMTFVPVHASENIHTYAPGVLSTEMTHKENEPDSTEEPRFSDDEEEDSRFVEEEEIFIEDEEPEVIGQDEAEAEQESAPAEEKDSKSGTIQLPESNADQPAEKAGHTGLYIGAAAVCLAAALAVLLMRKKSIES